MVHSVYSSYTQCSLLYNPYSIISCYIPLHDLCQVPWQPKASEPPARQPRPRRYGESVESSLEKLVFPCPRNHLVPPVLTVLLHLLGLRLMIVLFWYIFNVYWTCSACLDSDHCFLEVPFQSAGYHTLFLFNTASSVREIKCVWESPKSPAFQTASNSSCSKSNPCIQAEISWLGEQLDARYAKMHQSSAFFASEKFSHQEHHTWQGDTWFQTCSRLAGSAWLQVPRCMRLWWRCLPLMCWYRQLNYAATLPKWKFNFFGNSHWCFPCTTPSQ